MAGIPKILMPRLRQILADSNEFLSHSTLYAIFIDNRLKIFQKGLTEATDIGSRVDLTISYLVDKNKRAVKMP